MAEYLVVDVHVHTYQTREIGLRVKRLMGSTNTDYGGTPDELLAFMERNKISKAVMVNMLPVADMRDVALAGLPVGLSQVEREQALREIDARILGRLERRNAWTCSIGKQYPSLIPFISFNPLMDEKTMTEELLDKVKNHGAKGVKLHPGLNRFMPNDRRLWPGYRLAQQLGLPVISHAGGFAGPVQYAQPKNFVEVLDAFPNLILVMAHLGGMGYFDETLALARTYRNLCFDCTGIINRVEAGENLSAAEFIALVREVGVERVMFGSDWPVLDPVIALERLLNLDFTEREKRLLLAENAMRIYKL